MALSMLSVRIYGEKILAGYFIQWYVRMSAGKARRRFDVEYARTMMA